MGFLTADLGIGESARCMVRAADAASIPVALVPLKLNCRNRMGDLTFAGRLQETNPHGRNMSFTSTRRSPATSTISTGAAFRKNKFNIGYFAWELPDFPDSWTSSFDYFDEIWCPSNFVTEAVSLKAPFSVITMPHAVGFTRPTASPRRCFRSHVPACRQDRFLFLCLFDLNSYTARKNPRAAIEAFRKSGLADGRRHPS